MSNQVWAEVLTIGSELVLGQLQDTNAAYIASKLSEIGVGVAYHTTVGDDKERMRETFERALARCQIVITTGGIGPTEDDLTREIAARVTGRELLLRQDLVEWLEGLFQRMGYQMAPNNRRQAYIPEGAEVIANPYGTAPCFRCEDNGHVLICLPGVPRETEPLMEEAVLPYLKERFSPEGRIWVNRVLKVVGVGESNVDHQIRDLMLNSENPSIGINASPGEIKLRLTARANDRPAADRLLDKGEQELRDILGDLIFGRGEDSLAQVTTDLLKARRLSLAVAEALTGGLVAGELGRGLNPGQLVGGLILGRPVSADNACYEAEGQFPADITLAVAGAPNDSGRMQIDIVVRDRDGREATRELVIGGPHRLVMERAAIMSLFTLWRFLEDA